MQELSKGKFIATRLMNKGAGFFTYLEPISEESLSRKGMEKAASAHLNKEVTLLYRHDVEDDMQVKPTHRIYTMQSLSDYDRDQERKVANKTKQLVSKYSKK